MDIPVGTCHFTQIEGDNYVPVLYVYNADDPENAVTSGSAKETGCVLDLQEGQVLKITWTGTYISKFSSEWDDNTEKMLPSGTYVTGDIRGCFEQKILADCSGLDISDDAFERYVNEKIKRFSTANTIFGRIIDEDLEKVKLLNETTAISGIAIF